MLGTVWLILVALAFGGIVEKAGVLDRLIGPVIAAARLGRRPGRGVGRRGLRHQRARFRPVYRRGAARAHVPRRLRRAPACSGGAFPRARQLRHGDLRRLFPGTAAAPTWLTTLGVATVELTRPSRGLQLREPAADDRHRVRRDPDAARARGRRGTAGRTRTGGQGFGRLKRPPDAPIVRTRGPGQATG